MQIETHELASLLRGTSGAQVTPATEDLGQQIVVADRGFVYVGNVVVDRPRGVAVISEARNIRRWGTTNGLGELAANGPTENTKLDATGTVIVPLRAVIHFIKCHKPW